MSLAAILMAMATTAGQDKPEVRALPPGPPSVVTVPAPRSAPSEPRPINPGSWITQADYPEAARRAGAQGVVSMALTIDPNGRVTECRIERSSGNSDLDAAACRLTASRGRFEPALSPAGKPVAGKLTTNVRWELRGEPPRLPVPGEMVITLTVAPDGSVSDCSFAGQGGAATVADPCKTVPKFAPLASGKPQRVRLTNRVEHLEPASER